MFWKFKFRTAEERYKVNLKSKGDTCNASCNDYLLKRKRDPTFFALLSDSARLRAWARMLVTSEWRNG
eukprot:1639369-Amphidinium_carterae.1